MSHNIDPDAAALPDSGIYGLDFTPEESKVIIIPVPFEATISYRGGTSRGPAAVFAASHQVDLYDHETGKPYEAGITMLPIPGNIELLNREAKQLAVPIIQGGGVTKDNPQLQKNLSRVNAISEEVNNWVYEKTKNLLMKGKVPMVLGGDHATPFGAIKAYAKNYPSLGILHIDAHADLRNAYEGFTWSHASIMYNATTQLPNISKIVQVGVRDFCEAELGVIQSSGGRIHTFFDADISTRLAKGESFENIAQEIVKELPDEVYISFDIDGLDPKLCPHTGTPVPGGLSFQQASCILKAVMYP